MDSYAAQDRKVPPLSVRLSIEERERLSASARTADLSLSKYVRHILVGEADALDDLISKRGRQRHLPNMETVAEIARAQIALSRIADGLAKSNSNGSKVTLRALITQMEDIESTLTSLRRSRK